MGGASAEELFEKYRDEEKGNALARGKDYCKPVVASLCVRGTRVLAEFKQKRVEVDSDSDDDQGARVKRSRPEEEEARRKQANLAAIEAKYCAKVPSQGSASVPDSMRLG